MIRLILIHSFNGKLSLRENKKGEILIKTKNKLLMGFAVFLILFVLIGSVSATNDNITTSSQDTDNEISQEKISTGNDDSSLKEIENHEILNLLAF